jgi:hypothetical protein
MVLKPPTGREKILKAITTGFAFFALIVLVTEFMMVVAAVQVGTGWDRTFLFVSGVALLTLLILIVSLLLYYRPWVLTGDPPPAPIIKQLTPPPYEDTTPPLRYYLRGVREGYLRALSEAHLAPPPNVRLNVMLTTAPDPQAPLRQTLRIRHMDYANDFRTDELLEEYGPGEGNCGEAWRLRQIRVWASDLTSTARVPMDDVTSPTAQSRGSVLSCPIFWDGECLGVLNLDSSEGSALTHVQIHAIQNLFEEAAREIVPLLFPAAESKPVLPREASG